MVLGNSSYSKLIHGPVIQQELESLNLTGDSGFFLRVVHDRQRSWADDQREDPDASSELLRRRNRNTEPLEFDYSDDLLIFRLKKEP